ncbi:MAG: hypothetical protein IPO40_21850 [Fibrobacteres bacterium]|nr:hypothetical protein [Fibrobacterota bacterium]
MISGFILPSLAHAKDGWRVEEPGWFTRPPTTEKGIHGIGMGQSRDLPDASATADSLACREIQDRLVSKVVKWREQAKREGDLEGSIANLRDGDFAKLDVSGVKCQIQKRDHRKDSDGSFRAYSLGFLGKDESIAAVLASQDAKLKADAASVQDELDRAIQGASSSHE